MMTHNQRRAFALTRRTAVLLPLGLLGGCSLWDHWFGTTKPPLPGTRIDVMPFNNGLQMGSAAPRRVTLPPPAMNAAWPQAGGVASHDMEHLALGARLADAWTARIGTGGNYRRKLTAQPVIAGGRVFTMDADGVVSAFDAASGGHGWTLSTETEDNRSTDVGGGVATDSGFVYAATGRGDLVAIEAATGKIRWRKSLGTSARSAPTIADGKLFVPTIDNRLLAFAANDGRQLWSYQAATTETMLLGLPAPAYADGIVVAGFGSGELVALRAAEGAAAWSDSLAAQSERNSVADFSSIRGRSAIKDGRVYTIGFGGLMVANDLRTGRRLWERNVASTESPWLAGDWIFVLSTDSQLAALATDDGTVAWVTQLDRFENMAKKKDPIRWSGPVLAGDRLILGGSNKAVLTVNPITGKPIGQQPLAGVATLSPSLAGGTLYFLTEDATLTALR
jgi:outer membrane protein assembly factor BamB